MQAMPRNSRVSPSGPHNEVYYWAKDSASDLTLKVLRTGPAGKGRTRETTGYSGEEKVETKKNPRTIVTHKIPSFTTQGQFGLCA